MLNVVELDLCCSLTLLRKKTLLATQSKEVRIWSYKTRRVASLFCPESCILKVRTLVKTVHYLRISWMFTETSAYYA